MVETVVPDGAETDRQAPRLPVWVAVAVGAMVVGSLFLLSGGSETAAPVVTTIPEFEPVMAASWQLLELPGSAPLSAVDQAESGDYVAVGPGPQIWWSGDGVTWEAGASPPGPYLASSVAAFGDGAVVVGAEVDPSGDRRPAVAFTADRANWSLNEVEIERNAALEGVTGVGDLVVAWGWTGSAREFAPSVTPLVMTSRDGAEWTRVSLPDGLRVHAVVYLDDHWYLMGALGGKGALFQSSSADAWAAVDTQSLPFGWVMTDLAREDGVLVATLANHAHDSVGQWSQIGGGWEMLDRSVDGGARDDRPVGDVRDLVGDVAVGDLNGQPAVWVRGDVRPGVALPGNRRTGGWQVMADLGRGEAQGPWLLDDRWMVGNGRDWWLVSPEGVSAVPALAGMRITRVDRVGEEWVALPSMLWSNDGVDWEQRAEAWAAAGAPGHFASATGTASRAVAVGLNSEYLWTVAGTDDAGRTWTPVAEPAPVTPIWSIRPVPGGFVASAAGPRNRERIVFSDDGLDWEELVEGDLVGDAEPAAVVTPDGRLLFLDTGEELHLPAGAVVAVARGADGTVAVIASGKLWTGGPAWTALPLDTARGLSAARVFPLPGGDGVLALVQDRGSVQVVRWTG